MTQAKQGDTVKVHYTGKLSDGKVFDSSEGQEPLAFTIGKGRVIQGFESGVLGMEVGEKKTITIPPEEAYGLRNEELVAVINKSDIPSNIDVAVGQRLQIRQPDGQGIPVTMTEVTDESVTLDANHPLAGQELVFDVELMEIS